MIRGISISRSLLRTGLFLAVLLQAPVLLRAEEPAKATSEIPLHEQIDHLIEADHVGTPAPLTGDAEFLRRVYLDLIGRVPPVEVVREFLADESEGKRGAMIDRLLDHPAHAQHMATVFDVMLMERRGDKHIKNPEWQQYLLDSFQANKPLHVLAREILNADGVDPQMRPAARFYLDREGETNLLTRDVGRVFLGMDLQCAQCHNHPLIESYLQEDYYGLFAFLNRSFLFTDAKAKKTYFAEKAEGDVSFTSVFTEESGNTGPRLPGEEPIEEPSFEKGQEYEVKPEKDVRPVPKFSRREQLALQVTDGDYEAFNRNMANRLWAHMMGRGLVEPVDLHHPDNPPSHPEVLQLISEQLAAMNFDARAFLRQLALTRTYQRSFDMPANLAQQADEARQKIAALQAAEQQCLARAEQADESHLQAQIARRDAKNAFDEVAPRWNEATSALRAAETEHTAAAGKLPETQKQVALNQPAAESLAEAATKTGQAAAALTAAEAQAADGKTLAEVAATLKKRADELAAEAARMAAAMTEQQKARDAAAAKLAEARQQRESLAGAYEKVEAELAKQETQLQQRRAASVAADRAVRLAKRQVEQAQQLATLGEKIAAAEAAATKLQTAAKQVAEAETALAEATNQLARQREALAVARKQQDATEDAPEAAQQQLAELERQVADADQQAAALRTQLEQHKAEQAAARESLDSAAAQRDELFGELTEDWSHRFAVASLKPLQPEQLAWSLMQATGMFKRYLDAAAQELDKKQALPESATPEQRAERAREIEAAARTKLAGQLGAFINLFGAGAGQPQDEFFATVDQALFFANGSQLRGWLAPSGDNLCARLAALEGAEAIAEELYLSTLCRRPLPQEIEDVARQLEAAPEQKAEVVQNLAWGLLTSAEFRFNH